ncbi:MAG: 16S rRNA (cytosine(967)-C(5))-methyltransferase RsmB [Oscillospiraceae bacterium]|nr:16S rRNA (cytosine(967)-C(5))-methyltransferase RsmB [Oscillospiraceae bacterium]
MDSARITAAKALIKVDRGGFSQLVLDAALSNAKLDGRDAAFCSALFYGVIERRLTLDHCIAKYSRHALSDTVANVLRLAFYQLIYLDSVPAHAAVDEAVEMTKSLGQRAASGMVNGILRSFLRDGCKIPAIKGGKVQKLAINYSCSEQITELLTDWYGLETAESILKASMGRPPLFARVNTLKTDAASVIEHMPEYIKSETPILDGNCLEMTGDVAHTASHKIGFLHIQDICSQQAALTLEAQPGQRVLDVCAAPGSKSFVLAQQMKNEGEIISCDVYENRLGLISKGAKRLGISIIKTKQNDGSVYNPEMGEFDRILCDVPCSGLGVLRRKPEIKYRDTGSLEELAELQYKILETSSKYLKAGGMLVYSTCTVNPNENEKVIKRFLKENSGFEAAPFEENVWYKTNLPDEKGGDGFFISRIRRVQ